MRLVKVFLLVVSSKVKVFHVVLQMESQDMSVLSYKLRTRAFLILFVGTAEP